MSTGETLIAFIGKLPGNIISYWVTIVDLNLHLYCLINPDHLKIHIFKWAPCLNAEVPRLRRIANFVIFLIPTGKSYSLKDYFWVLWSYLSSAVREIFTKFQITRGVEKDTIALQFEHTWNMPHVIGTSDGKNVRIKCPNSTASLYHDYKGFFSLVLPAICDANYCFTLLGVGQYDSNNDCGVLVHSNMGEYSEDHSNYIPQPESVEGCDFDPLPYFLVEGEIFPLKTWLMQP